MTGSGIYTGVNVHLMVTADNNTYEAAFSVFNVVTTTALAFIMLLSIHHSNFIKNIRVGII